MQLTVGEVLRVKEWMREKRLRVAVLGAVLLLVFTGYAKASDGDVSATQTALTVSTNNDGPRTKASLTAKVSAISGFSAPTGVVTFLSGNTDLGSAVVDSEGKATVTTDNLTAGSHTIVAAYRGDTAHASSLSASSLVDSATSTVAGYTITAAPTSLNIAAGAFATTVVTITPVNGFNAYVSLSCSELPINTTCSFAPTNVLASCTATSAGCVPANSTLQIQTLTSSGTRTPTSTSRNRTTGNHLQAYAFALPAIFGLAGLSGLGRGRCRNVLKVLLVVFLFGGMLTLSACKEQYNYLNHGPTPNLGTPTGTYSITVNSVSVTGSLITTPPTSPQLTLTVTN